jgi:hypothetical protein
VEHLGWREQMRRARGETETHRATKAGRMAPEREEPCPECAPCSCAGCAPQACSCAERPCVECTWERQQTAWQQLHHRVLACNQAGALCERLRSELGAVLFRQAQVTRGLGQELERLELESAQLEELWARQQEQREGTQKQSSHPVSRLAQTTPQNARAQHRQAEESNVAAAAHDDLSGLESTLRHCEPWAREQQLHWAWHARSLNEERVYLQERLPIHSARLLLVYRLHEVQLLHDQERRAFTNAITLAERDYARLCHQPEEQQLLVRVLRVYVCACLRCTRFVFCFFCICLPFATGQRGSKNEKASILGSPGLPT